MTNHAVPQLVVNEKTEAGASLVGVLAAMGAAYYTGKTGNPDPLFIVSCMLVLLTLFITSN